MPITEAPIDVSDLVAPADLRRILQKQPSTPVFNRVLAKHGTRVTRLRKQVWPVVATDPAGEPQEPADEPEATPQPDAPQTDAPQDPTPEFTEPEATPNPGDEPTEDR